MFDNFPYTDMHQLNLDWIIKIAKDFLDQYTHLQELIENGEESLQNLTTEGLQQLQEKADNLEQLLQEWYDTHSSDIANELTDALADLNQLLATNQQLFNVYAENRALQTIASIPSDYTLLYNEVQSIEKASHETIMRQFCKQDEYSWTPGYWKIENNTIVLDNMQPQYKAIILNDIPEGYYFINNYSSNQTFVKNLATGTNTSLYDMGYQTSNQPVLVYIPASSDVYITINTQNVSIKTSVFSNVWGRLNILNPYNWTSGYWNNDETYTEDPYYHHTVIHNCKPGIYEFNYYASWQTYIKRLSNNAMTSMGSLGYTSSNTKITIQIPYECDIFLTQRSDALAYQENTLFYHDVITSDKLDYGNYTEADNTFYVGPTRKIKKLVDGIELAKRLQNSTLIVEAGNYNMFEELGGSTYFDTYVADTNVPTDFYEPNWGIFLSNGIHIICQQGTDIYFLYTGSNTDVQSKFSLFNGGTGGFTLENALIRTQNIRYSVHDDMGSFAFPYETKYINCVIDHDSSGTTWGAHQAIGGGFGRHGIVRIESCIISSTYWLPVSYHNAAGDINAEKTSGVSSRLYMIDTWLSGAITTNAYGRSQDMTIVVITNCCVGATLPDPEITGPYNVMNVRSIRWNNTIHN